MNNLTDFPKNGGNQSGSAPVPSSYFFVQESKTQQPLTLFQGASIHGGTFNTSVNSLNESPTLSLQSSMSKKALNHAVTKCNFIVFTDKELRLTFGRALSVQHFISMRT